MPPVPVPLPPLPVVVTDVGSHSHETYTVESPGLQTVRPFEALPPGQSQTMAWFGTHADPGSVVSSLLQA